MHFTTIFKTVFFLRINFKIIIVTDNITGTRHDPALLNNTIAKL